MSEAQISGWEKERESGRFSFILKETIILTPLIMIFCLAIRYFFDEQAIDSKTVFESAFTSLFMAFIIGAINLFQREASYKKSVLHNKKN